MKKHIRVLFFVALLALFFISVIDCLAMSSKPPRKSLPQYKANELLVKFNEGTNQAEKNSARKVVKAKFIKELKSIDVELWELPDDITVEDAIETLNGMSIIKYVEPNYLFLPQLIPNDPYFNNQWYLRNTGQTVNGLTGTAGADISILDAWDIETGSSDVIIAVIDSGHPHNHPDFLDYNNTWLNTIENENGLNFVDDDGNGYIDDISGWDFANGHFLSRDFSRFYDGSGGHGAHVAGIIAAQGNNGTGTTGVMWDAQIMPIKIFDDFAYAINHPPAASVMIDAIHYAVSNGAKIINLSLGSYNYSQSVYDIISYANENNVLVICAAGNNASNNDTTPAYPASYSLPNIISVAATNELDELASYSNFGQSTVHVAAPGGSGSKSNIYSTLPPEREVIFFENFEFGGSQWNVNYIYEPFAISYDSFWGSNVASDSIFNYHSYEDSYLTTNNKIIVPPLCFGLHAFYQIQYSLEYLYDFAYVAVSDDGINFDTVHSYTGESYGIQTIQKYISYLGEDISFYLRFGIESDALYNYDGVKLDNFFLSCVPWEYDGNEFGYMSGTSMAAPVVSGIAGLIMSKYPELTHLEVKDAILNSVDELDSLTQKVVTGGRVNAARALEIAAPTATTTITTTTIPTSNPTTTTTVPVTTSSGGGGGGGGGGIFGDILKSSVIGYHLDGWTADGIEIYMPVTQGFKALKGTQEYVRSFAPNLARSVRECFDYFEQKADANKEGFLYQAGTYIFPILGKVAEKALSLIGQEKYINEAYSKTTISIEEFNKLKNRGMAIAPKAVKDKVTLIREQAITDLVLV